MRPFRRPLLTVCLALIVAAAPALAQDEEPELGWSDSAELSFVSTGGNSESTTIGFKNLTTRRWQESLLEIKAGAIRAESDNITRICVGADAATCDPQELKVKEVNADQYYLNGKYSHTISPSFYWFAGLGWTRNRPAGIDNRYLAEAGLGNIWRDTEKVKFRTDYGLTYTDEQFTSTPDLGTDFMGLRASYTYSHKLTETTTFDSSLIGDLNLDDTDDWRLDWLNSVAVSMTKTLALKASLQILYDHQPGYEDGEIWTTDDPGSATGTFVPVQLDTTDTIFTASLVINF